jgi:hypothetical protein
MDEREPDVNGEPARDQWSVLERGVASVPTSASGDAPTEPPRR